MDTVLEILKYTLPSGIVLLTAWLVLKTFLQNKYKERYMELQQTNAKQLLPIRIQAYERLTMFLERISPANLLHRMGNEAVSASDLRMRLTNTVRQEFEHNFSQQIYVSVGTWNIVVTVKEELISVINQAAASLEDNAPAVDLSKAVMTYYMDSNKVPMQEALEKIKIEARKLF
jgi:hypothetical protein